MNHTLLLLLSNSMKISTIYGNLMIPIFPSSTSGSHQYFSYLLHILLSHSQVKPNFVRLCPSVSPGEISNGLHLHSSVYADIPTQSIIGISNQTLNPANGTGIPGLVLKCMKTEQPQCLLM